MLLCTINCCSSACNIWRRGEITADEMDNLTLLYDPYVALGGNGTIKKLMERVGIYVKIIDERSKNNELED